MASVNRVTLIGNLGRDPEVRSFPDGGAICNITVATTRTWKSKDGEKQEETEWSRVVFRGRLAEIAGKYLRKGKSVYIDGYLKTRKWQDKEGRDTYTTEIVAEQMQMLGSRDSSDDTEPARPRTHGEQQQAKRAEYQAPKSGGGFYDMDDDIPF